MSAKEIILEYFNKINKKEVSFNELKLFLHLETKEEKNQLRITLEALEKNKQIIHIGESYMLYENSNLVEGIIHCNERGYAFLETNIKGNDLFIPNCNLNGAFQGDKVVVCHYKTEKHHDEAVVIKILERGVKQLSGIYYERSGLGFVHPDDKSFLSEIKINKINSNYAKPNDKVFIEIIKYSKEGKPEGKILQVIGKKFDLDVEEKAIILNSGIDYEFSLETLSEAEKIKNYVSDKELKDRKDLRNEIIFTIDGDDAKDFDDAVSLKIINNGNYLLGVHIADVTAYVANGGKLDETAITRGTSVYLPDKVIPMLPFQLSNGICSLNEGVDRLTLSVFIEINLNGDIISTKIFKSVINSKRRMTYNVVQKIIDGNNELKIKYSDVVDSILLMNKLKNLLANRRKSLGALELDVLEADVKIENGQIFVKRHDSTDATKLIEQFMVLANESVAEYLTKNKYPCVYRIHGSPDEDRLNTFIKSLNVIGINVKWNTDNCNSKDFQSLLEKIEGSPISGVVNKLMLRTMQKAVYSTENIGHFGLGSECYCHFTSPIRRYPDLAVHRILKDVLDKKSGIIDLYGDFANRVLILSSLNEKKAEKIERDVEDLYKAKFMQKFIGYEFDGVISGVTNFGVFVELDNTCEGLIRIEDLPRSNYEFISESYTLKGKKYSFTLGEQVRIGVVGVDITERRVDFIFLSKLNENNNFNKKITIKNVIL